MKTRSLRVHGISLFVAMLLVIGSLRIPVRVDAHEELARVRLGFPFHFVEQNQSQYDPPFPFSTFLLSPWESPPHFSWLQFLLSWILVFVVTDALLFLLVQRRNGFKKSTNRS